MGLDVARAADLYRRAVDLTPEDDAERAPRLARLGDAAAQVGRLEEGEAALRSAADLYRRAGSAAGVGRTLVRLFSVQRFQGAAAAAETLREAIATLEGIAPGPELVEAYAEMASIFYVLGDDPLAMEWAQRSNDTAGANGLPVSPRALEFIGGVRAALGDASGLEEIRRAARMAADRGSAREFASAQNNLGTALYAYEGPAAALDEVRTGIEFAERRGVAETSVLKVTGVEMLWLLGRWNEALEASEKLPVGGEGTPTPGALKSQLPRMAIMLARGEMRSVQSDIDRVLQWSRESGETQNLGPAIQIAAQVAFDQGDGERARDLLLELAALPRIAETWNLPSYLPGLVGVAISCGETALVRALNAEIPSVTPFQRHAINHAQRTAERGRRKVRRSGGDVRRGGASLGDVPDGALRSPRADGTGPLPDRP